MWDTRKIIAIQAVIALLVWWAWSIWGCAATGRIEQVEQSIVALEKLQIGGDGDSVTAWIYAAKSWIDAIGSKLSYGFVAWLIYRLAKGGRFGPSISKEERANGERP